MIKKTINLKFFIFFKIIFFLLCFSFDSYANNINKKPIVLGSDNAPVKIKIFSSFTCPHCADFHMNIIPKINKKYVKTEKVQLIFIDFPLDQVSFNASKLLHCVKENDQISFMDKIYEKQSGWASGTTIEEINKNLKEIVKDFNIDSKKFDKCLIDENISDKILEGRIDAHKKYSISSTPTIIINEKKLKGSNSFENIEKKIKKLI
jgi:protein-disulfide isomerase